MSSHLRDISLTYQTLTYIIDKKYKVILVYCQEVITNITYLNSNR
ncbi:hypothetical protein RBEAN4_1440 [Rickettsia bellii str. RML An4]|uniref:Uncharacterized protein n=1 Tax=Rickettsia bellii str. RML An4 TaxID=1359193 RepID=A0A0F3QE47_RICBE|nr:hypothetical protein RBEAN4_1440 [Rickettsia bellii str. RML An4]